MKIAVQGSFPKIPAGPGASVRTQIQRFDRQVGSPKDLDRVYREVTARVLKLAADVGLDATTDGQIRWNDWFDPIVRDVDNIYSEGLLRLYDNNFYYRHPVVRGRLAFQGGTLRFWTEQALVQTTVPLKVTLPGPFTFLALSEDLSYRNRDRLLRDLLDVLKLERDSLVGTGVVEVQWDEPSLARANDFEADEVKDVLKALLADATMPQSLALFWGSASHRWLEPLSELNLATVYVDTVADPEVLPLLESNRWPYAVGVGAIDARNVRLEDPSQLARQLEPILARQSADRVILHPTSGLELLPPDRAEAKVWQLARVRDAVLGTAKS
jgi:5-methyltetrahydropteroyltriglutamate--homocysteine methyltransferase